MRSRPQLARIADALLARSPAQRLARRRAGRHVAVLAYHGVDDADCFARQLDSLVRCCHPISLDEFLDAVHGRGRLPDHAVLITFDDGQRSVLDVGLPLLRERGLPAVVYVVAGLVDGDTPYWWTEAEALSLAGGRSTRTRSRGRDLVRELKRVPDRERLAALAELRATSPVPPPAVAQLRAHELRRLESAGVAIGNHSLTHPCLQHCDDDKIRSEVIESQRILTEALGRPPRSFAYPNGDFDDRVVAAVNAAGFDAAFLFDHRLAAVPPDDRLRISRLRVDSTTTVDRFQITLSGIHPALHRLRGGT